ncbi:HEAT repeat domain-containing protein [Streptomyces cynarae]|uniref:HEAT repeat domain-containing protein n=1 Tax=Streptomyces cynarae TaxID=2981134 RepID=A0ABY6DTF3_9ACTN|nr:HEAT repeat domain-containing protein [Streptomyces cynarae]UXY17508.1 HEAT repeat domain-containing protein [Streptomyces cynarae]
MTGTTGGEEDKAERATLRCALNELDERLATGAERVPGAHLLFKPLVEQLRTPAAAFLRPELEQRLARHVAADDSFARDQIAHALAGTCGRGALPALLRAMATDRNDDGDRLQLDVLELFEEWPETALSLSLDCAASDDPGTRRVGLWGLSIIDFGGTKYFGLVADAASDPDPKVRADVMCTLGTIFGTGDPPRARAILIAGTCDAAPEVRCAAVAALYSSRDEKITDILVARASDADRWVRYWAAWSLARRPAPQAHAALKRLTTDEDADVRDAARQALARPT